MDAEILAVVKDVLLAAVSAWTIYQEKRLRDICSTCRFKYTPKDDSQMNVRTDEII